MATVIDFYYRAGEIRVRCRVRPKAVRGITLLGNPWRGLMVLPGLALVGFGYLLPGLIVLGLALPWSILSVMQISWGEIASYQRAVGMVRSGDLPGAYDMFLDDTQAPWLWLMGKAMETENWELALDCLANWNGEDEGKSIWQALCYMEQGFPAKALALLPNRQLRDILLVRAKGLYLLGDWEKLLSQGRRGSETRDKYEYLWLRAKAYLARGEERPARYLLRQLVQRAGNDYGGAGELLRELMEKEGIK